MMQNWAQYVKKTARFHPKAENFPQVMINLFKFGMKKSLSSNVINCEQVVKGPWISLKKND